MISKERVIELAEERIAELDNGCFLVDVVISNGNNILVEIDNEITGIAINDCVRVSRNIEHNLDREEQDFELSVMSPGLSNPFKVHQQYVKNIGRNVKVLFDHKSIEGLLKEVSDTGIVLETSSKQRLEGKKKKVLVVENHQIAFEDIKETKVVISFK